MSGPQTAIFVLSIVAGNLLLLYLMIRGISWLFCRLSGWNRLAARFAAGAPPAGWTLLGESVKVGAIRYRRCVKAGIQPDGLYLAVSGILRHPTLRIPWSELHNPRSDSFYGRPSVALSVGNPALNALLVYPEFYRLICPYLAGAPTSA